MPHSALPRGLSVIVPCYNEESVIQEAHRRLSEILGSLAGLSYEIIYVDDGSKDGTLGILRDLQTGDSHVKILSFSRNFGQQIALSAGIEKASGEAVVFIDADLQDPPEVIPEMVHRWREGAEIVYGQREQREGETRLKLFTAKLFYRVINLMSDVPIPLDTGDFRLIDRKVADVLLEMPEHDRFLRGMIAWTGFKQESVRYQRAPRLAGITKYSMTKMIRLAMDGILSFSLVPLRMAIWMGFAVAMLSCFGIIYALIVRLTTQAWVPGWAMLFVAILFLGGVQLIFLGVIGEYLGRVYLEQKRRPLHLIREQYGFDNTRAPAPSESE